MPAPATPDYLRLSYAVYTTGGVPVAPTGWSVLTNGGVPVFQSDSTTGMQAVAFQNNSTHEIVVAFEGTYLPNAISNHAMLFAQGAADDAIRQGIKPAANDAALNFLLQQVLPAAGSNPIYLTGHSLGGEEAEYVAANAAAHGVTISGGETYGAPAVPQQANVAFINFKDYEDFGDVIARTSPAGSGYVGTRTTTGNAQDGANEDSVITNGVSGLLIALGIGVSDHVIANYAADLGVNLPSSTDPVSQGGLDVAELGIVNGTPLYGPIAAPQVNGNDVTINGDTFASGNGYTTVTLTDGSTVDVVTVSDTSINVPTTNGNLAIVDSLLGNSTNSAEIVNTTLGTTSFVDLTGDPFASYTSTQLTGGTIKVSGNEIDVWNSANQLLNSTQEVDLGGGVDGVLDKVWNSANPGITEVNINKDNSTTVQLRDDGKGLAIDNATGKPYFYGNGTIAPITIPQITNAQGVVVGVTQFFIDDNNDIIARMSGQSAGSLIYSGATSSYAGGSTQALLGPSGQAFEVFGVSNNGKIIVGYVQGASSTTWYVRNNGVFTPITLPSYTDSTGFQWSTFQVQDVNDNGVIAGYFITNADGQVGATFNYNTGAVNVLPVQGANSGLIPNAINDAGEVVGMAFDTADVRHAFLYSNGVLSEVSIPGVVPHEFGPLDQFGHPINPNADEDITRATDITNDGTIVVQHIHDSASNSLEDFAVSDIVSPSATAVTSTLNLDSTGTVDLSTSPQFANTAVRISNGNSTITLASGDSLTAADSGNDVVFGGSSNSVTVGGNGEFGAGDFVTISGGHVSVQDNAHADVYGGSNTITIGQNDLVGVQNGNNNAITAGTGSNIYVNSGTGDVITASAGGVTIFAAAGVSLGLVGGNNGVVAANGDTVNVSGNGQFGNSDFVTISNGTVTVADNARTDIYGGSNNITAGQNDLIGVQNGGSNTLTLGSGTQLYLNSGNGDVVNAANGNVTIFAAGLVSLSLVDGGNTVFAADGDTVNVSGNGQFGNSDYLNIANGTVNVAANARADIYGGSDHITAGANTLIGIQNGDSDTVTLGSNSQIYVNSGTNHVINGGGNDQYFIAPSFGQDTINNGTGTAANGSLIFGSGITDEKLWFKQSGNDLIVQQLGTTDQIDIAGWFAGAGKQVQEFDAGGLKLDTQVALLVQAMASYATAHTGFNPTTATTMPTDTTLQNAIAAAWHSP